MAGREGGYSPNSPLPPSLPQKRVEAGKCRLGSKDIRTPETDQTMEEQLQCNNIVKNPKYCCTMSPAQRSFIIFDSGPLSAILVTKSLATTEKINPFGMFWGFPKCTSSVKVKISRLLSNTNYLPKTLIYSTIQLINREELFSGLLK